MSWADSAFRLLAAPLLIGQALRIRRIAQSLPEAAGPRRGTLGQGPRLRLALIGDSSAAGVGVDQQSEALAGQVAHALAADFTVDWQLNALTGATTTSTLSRLEAAQPEAIDVVVIVLGVNDATRLIPSATWVRHQNRLLDRTKALYDQKLTVFSAMPPLDQFPLLPQPLRWTLGRHAARMAQRRLTWLKTQSGCVHLPFDLDPDPALMATDGFHPSAKLYALWGAQLAAKITAHVPREGFAPAQR